MSAKLERCPECGSRWPNGPDFALRGCGWLQGLSRSISPTNNDVTIHDGFHNRNRFLHFEFKTEHEPWPPRKGELWMLRAIAESETWTVRILRGSTRALDVHRVTATGLEFVGLRTHTEAVRRAVDAWLSGALWRDAEKLLVPPPDKAPIAGHICGWARVEGVWTCIQDHYAVGLQPETSCGATLPGYP